MKTWGNGLVIGLILSVLTCGTAAAQKELLIGLIPEMNVFKQMERFKPLSAYLKDKTGLPVRFKVLSRYGNILDNFTREKLDGAFFGSFTGALAIRKLGVIPLARPVNPDGESTYQGYLYTRKDSGIKTVKEMRGKKFAFVDKATTAGYIFPMAVLKSEGVNDLQSYFSEYFFAGSHDASLDAVLNQKADVGVSKNTVFDWVRKNEPRVDEEITILSKSAKVPSNGLCVRPTLAPELRNKLKKALMELDGTPQGLQVLKSLNALRFIETTTEDYDPVFDLVRKAGIDLDTYDYRND